MQVGLLPGIGERDVHRVPERPDSDREFLGTCMEAMAPLASRQMAL